LVVPFRIKVLFEILALQQEVTEPRYIGTGVLRADFRQIEALIRGIS
jgi:hypothetical protein